jgi:hypothetical protein
VFQCSRRPALHAATLDGDGLNLPKHRCPSGDWIRTGQLIVRAKRDSFIGTEINTLKAGIEQDGYYLWNADAEVLLIMPRLML